MKLYLFFFLKPTQPAFILTTIVIIKVETSDDKTPPQDTLGSPAGLFLPRASSNDASSSSNGSGNGHIARNLRLLLATTDLVEPYVEWAFDAMEMADVAAAAAAAANERGRKDQQQPVRYWEASSDGSAGRGAATGGHGAWLWSGTVTVADDLTGNQDNTAETSTAPAAVNSAIANSGATDGLSVGNTEASRSANAEPKRVAWRVGGALLVDHTELVVGCWPNDDDDNDHKQGDSVQAGLRGKRGDNKKGSSASGGGWAALLSEEERGAPTSSSSSSSSVAQLRAQTMVLPASRGSGNGRWASPSTLLAATAPPPASSGHLDDSSGGSGEDGHIFWASLPSASELLKLNCSPDSSSSGGAGGGASEARYFAAARAVVDAKWGIAPKGAQPEGELGAQPQGHLAQVRVIGRSSKDLYPFVLFACQRPVAL